MSDVSLRTRAAFDFFIAHAGPDRGAAECLFDLLNDHLSVFLDSRSLQLGDDWDRALPEAQRHAKVTVVMVSRNTEDAFYQRDEIAAAIDMARGEKAHRVVPVYLTPRRELGDSLPYGLRVKHGIEVSDEVPLEAVAAELLKLTDRHEAASAPPEEAVPMDLLFSQDPTLASPVVDSLIEAGEAPVDEIVARLRGLNRVQVRTLRRLLAAFAEQSADPMVERIRGAGMDWHAAVMVPDCLSPVHLPYCGEPLADAVASRDPDVIRLALDGLGFMGAEPYAPRVERVPRDSDDYEYGKYAYNAVVARARMVVMLHPAGFNPAGTLTNAFQALQYMIGVIERRGWPGSALEEVSNTFEHCAARHADDLLRWLGSDVAVLRQLAATALGALRLRRVLPYLIERSEADYEPKVVAAAAASVGIVGGADAVASLERLLERHGDEPNVSKPVRDALARCLADADDHQFARLAEVLMDDPWVAWRAYRAVGVRRDDRFATALVRGLQALDAVTRGEAALALARLQGDVRSDELTRAYDEAVTPMERVLTALALLTIDAVPSRDRDLTRLCADLAGDSYAWDGDLQRDILDGLRDSSHPRAGQIAAAWEPMYARGLGF